MKTANAKIPILSQRTGLTFIDQTIRRAIILFLQNIGLIPIAQVNVNVVTNVKIVSHGVRMIKELRALHRSNDFCEELLSLTSVMRISVIRINLIVKIVRGRKLFEVNLTRLDVENESRMVTNCQRTLDAILLADSLDRGGQFLLVLLRHVSHLILHHLLLIYTLISRTGTFVNRKITIL